jgi:ribonuclease HI
MIVINIDGAARGNPGPAGYGIYATDVDGEQAAQAFGYIGEQTNNFAEYTALLAAFELARKNKWNRLRIKSDSQLLVRQMRGEYKVKNTTLQAFHRRARSLRAKFDYCSIEHIKRSENKEADRLANVAINKQISEPRDINPIRIKQK